MKQTETGLSSVGATTSGLSLLQMYHHLNLIRTSLSWYRSITGQSHQSLWNDLNSILDHNLQTGKAIAVYVSALDQLKEFCNFGASSDDLLRDRQV